VNGEKYENGLVWMHVDLIDELYIHDKIPGPGVMSMEIELGFQDFHIDTYMFL
jgi:hypothetical protein